MQILRRAVLWAVTGSLLAVVIWSVLAGVLWQFYYHHPASVREALTNWPLAVVGSAIWALVIAAVAAPSYCVVFAAWQLVLRRVPAWDRTEQRQALAALVLGAPPAIMLTWGFASSSGFPFDWAEAARIAPLAVLSCCGGVWLPRRIVRPLQGQLVPSAG